MESFIFSVQSDQLSFANEPVLIQGIGFHSLQLSCRISSEHEKLGKDESEGKIYWYSVEVKSDTEAWCFSPIEGQNSIV